MTRVTIDLNDEMVEALLAQIADSRPTLKDVVHHALERIVERWNDEAGIKRLCRCGTLERMADDPTTPVEFDPSTNVFKLVYENARGSRIIRYCFHCGDRAPPSKAPRTFALVSPSEKLRLAELCKDIHTFSDAVRTFGPPDHDYPSGMTRHSTTKEGRDEWSVQRVFVYSKLSETADVRFTQSSGELVSLGFWAKPLGAGKDPPGLIAGVP
jgi:hypothetical protein